jgi:hypothetical protein
MKHAWGTVHNRLEEHYAEERRQGIQSVARTGDRLVDLASEVAAGYNNMTLLAPDTEAKISSVVRKIPRGVGILASAAGSARILLNLPGYISWLSSGIYSLASYVAPVAELLTGGVNPIIFVITTLLLIAYSYDFMKLQTAIKSGKLFSEGKAIVQNALAMIPGLGIQPAGFEEAFNTAVERLSNENVVAVFSHEEQNVGQIQSIAMAMLQDNPELFWGSVAGVTLVAPDGTVHHIDTSGAPGSVASGASEISGSMFGAPGSQERFGIDTFDPADYVASQEVGDAAVAEGKEEEEDEDYAMGGPGAGAAPAAIGEGTIGSRVSGRGRAARPAQYRRGGKRKASTRKRKTHHKKRKSTQHKKRKTHNTTRKHNRRNKHKSTQHKKRKTHNTTRKHNRRNKHRK